MGEWGTLKATDCLRALYRPAPGSFFFFFSALDSNNILLTTAPVRSGKEAADFYDFLGTYFDSFRARDIGEGQSPG